MIREFKTDNLDAIMKIWLKTNIKAHSFISEAYWKGNYDTVREMLPDATIFIYEDHDTIQGFVGLVDNYIAGIFVGEDYQSKGIGKALLDHIKKTHSELSLHVYKKNVSAVRFYKREAFIVLKEQVEENTNETELVMNWAR